MSDLEIVENDETTWLTLVDFLMRSFAAPQILPVEREGALASLLQLQVTAGSALGAIALNCGGILLHHGWLRIFGGSPCEEMRLPSIAQINGFPAHVDRNWTPTEGLIIAHDVLGGVFLLNGMRPGAGRPGVPGEVIYFDPHALTWSRMKMSHSEWLAWCVSGDLAQFYGGLLWPRWRQDVMVLRADQGIATFHAPEKGDASAMSAEVIRTVAPMAEILRRQFDAAQQRGQQLDRILGLYPVDRLCEA